MKAVAWTRYGPPANALKLVEADKPSPKKNELLIKVSATTVTSGDARLRGSIAPAGFRLLMRLAFGLFRPRRRIPGMNFSGEVEAVGEQVSAFKVGDRVYGSSGMQMGAHAEYLCLSESAAIIKPPAGIDHQEAAASVFGGMTAIHFVKEKAGLGAGQRILINGASGSVGVASVQLAKHLGAEMTAVCSSANVELLSRLGADRVIDYTREAIEDRDGGFDFVLDTVGNLPLARCKDLLNETGRLIAINTGLLPSLSSVWNRRLICGVAEESKASLEILNTLLESGHFKPVIDRVHTLDQIVDAHERVDTGHKVGSVVISVEASSP